MWVSRTWRTSSSSTTTRGMFRLIEEASRASSLDPIIHTTTTREEALDLLYQGGVFEEVPRPDLILLDWNLSKHTGEKVIETAKSGDAPILVVVMTGARSGLSRIESSAPAADDYIEKQTEPHDYIEILRSCGVEP